MQIANKFWVHRSNPIKLFTPLTLKENSCHSSPTVLMNLPPLAPTFRHKSSAMCLPFSCKPFQKSWKPALLLPESSNEPFCVCVCFKSAVAHIVLAQPCFAAGKNSSCRRGLTLTQMNVSLIILDIGYLKIYN